jgi:hypothetical protein
VLVPLPVQYRNTTIPATKTQAVRTIISDESAEVVGSPAVERHSMVVVVVMELLNVDYDESMLGRLSVPTSIVSGEDKPWSLSLSFLERPNCGRILRPPQ